MSNARDHELQLAAVEASTVLAKLAERNEELTRENRRLKGRLRAEAAAKSRLRRRLGSDR